MEREIQNDYDCIYENNFEQSLQQQMLIEDYIRQSGKPVNLNDTEIQEILNILNPDFQDENMEEDKE